MAVRHVSRLAHDYRCAHHYPVSAGRTEHLSASIGTVVSLTSVLGNIGPLVMPVVFGLLIDFN